MTVTSLISDPSGPQWSRRSTRSSSSPSAPLRDRPFTPWHHSRHPGGVLSIILSININSRYSPQCPRSFGAGVLFAFYQPHPAASKESINCQCGGGGWCWWTHPAADSLPSGVDRLARLALPATSHQPRLPGLGLGDGGGCELLAVATAVANSRHQRGRPQLTSEGCAKQSW